MANVAYVPTSLSKGSNIVEERKKNFPFIHNKINSGAGISNENFIVPVNVVLTGIFLNGSVDAAAGAAAAMATYLNGERISYMAVYATLTSSNSQSVFISLPSWDISSNNILRTETNCTATAGATITYIGYYL